MIQRERTNGWNQIHIEIIIIRYVEVVDVMRSACWIQCRFVNGSFVVCFTNQQALCVCVENKTYIIIIIIITVAALLLLYQFVFVFLFLFYAL